MQSTQDISIPGRALRCLLALLLALLFCVPAGALAASAWADEPTAGEAGADEPERNHVTELFLKWSADYNGENEFVGAGQPVKQVVIETKGLLVGEGMKHQSLDELRALVEEDPNIIECGRILTMYMGPQNLLIAIDATFKGDISAREVLIAVDAAERRIMERWPEAGRVFIEVESMRVCLDQQIQEASWEDEYEDEYEEAVEEARALPDAAADEEADVIGEAMEAAEEAAEVAAAAALAAEEAAAIAASARAAASAAEQEAAEALAEHAAEMGRQAADRAVADRAAEKIANIGSVSLESSKAVGKARKAYDKLTPEQALLVGNYDALLKAEKKLKKLKKAEKQRRKEAQAAADAIRAAANQQDD